MTWENRDADDKNLESMRQEFGLENIMNSDILTTEPVIADIGQGQFRLYHDGTDLYLYTNYDGSLLKVKWTAA